MTLQVTAIEIWKLKIKTPKPWTLFANWFYNKVDESSQQNDLSKQWTYCAFQLWNVSIGLDNFFQVKIYINPIRLTQFLSNFDVKNFVHCMIHFTITCYCSSHIDKTSIWFFQKSICLKIFKISIFHDLQLFIMILSYE